MKIVNRKKFVRGILIISFFIALFVININNSALSYGEITKKQIKVAGGETLWSIAENEKEENLYYKDKDIRQVVYDIKNVNGLSSSTIMPGQILEIPTV